MTAKAPTAAALTPTVRDRLARPVVLIYWLLLGAGLALYTAESGSSLPLWIGAIAGTVFGHVVALRDFRLWFVAVLIGGVVYIAALAAPAALQGPQMYMAFIPAALCAYASLSDRWSLAAVWFPAVIWMLSILDRTHGTTQVDTIGAVFLGALALGFIGFLRARESRRVGIWTRVAPMPLAQTAPVSTLRETPGFGFMRAGWTLGVTALTFALTAWIAPRLWKLEVARHHVQVAGLGVGMGVGGSGGIGLPCCPVGEDALASRTRVREYLDLGRGREDTDAPDERHDCRACPSGGDGSRIHRSGQLAYGGGGGGGGVAPATVTPVGPYGDPPTARYTATDDFPAQYNVEPAPYVAPTPYVAPAPYGAPPPYVAPAPYVAPPRTIHAAPPVTPRVTPMPPPVAHLPAPPASPLVTPPRVVPPAVASTSARPVAPPAVVPPAEPREVGASVIHWIATLLAFAVLFQLVTLTLRPLRRAITLRHLRRAMWAETVDQRVSNWWQLALVGLRDGGWRVRGGETPTELARRVDIPALARCATILERARYGIQIDDGDLDGMSTSADAVYSSARARISTVARALSWLRWPLT